MAKLIVRVTPRASRDGITGWGEDGVLLVRVAAPPADGAANAAVARVLAKALGLAGRDIVLVRGATSRVKQFDVPLSEEELRGRLGGPASP